MKSKFLLFGLLFIVACSSVKQANKALSSGNYEEAIHIAVNRLQKNKDKKSDKEQVAILEKAFEKFKDSYTNKIAFLQKENRAYNTQQIYDLYVCLNRVQNDIYPLLPLVKNNGSEARFDFEDYSDEIIKAKADYVAYLYDNSSQLLKSNQKSDFRKAYNQLKDLTALEPNYKNTKTLLEEAHFKGTDFYLVRIVNSTEQMIPRKLEDDLLDFNTYGLDNFWKEFHSVEQRNVPYAYEVVLDFREILVSPERISEKEIALQKEIKDGYVYKTDRNGNYILDENGNKIKEDKIINVSGTLLQVIQTKSLAVTGQVQHFDVAKDKRINTFPLQTEFIFENVFAEFKGDNRVLSKDEKAMVNNKFVPFPSNEQMLFDASSEIKSRLAAILKRM